MDARDKLIQSLKLKEMKLMQEGKLSKANWNNLAKEKELDEIIEGIEKEKENILMCTDCSWKNPFNCKVCRSER